MFGNCGFRYRLAMILLLVAGTTGAVTLLAEPKRQGESKKSLFVFRDTTDAADLSPHLSGIQGHAAGWGDVDNDGWIDLYVGTFAEGNAKANRLLRNSKGSFTLDSQAALQIAGRFSAAVFADLDNDGDLDLYVSSMPQPEKGLRGCALFRNEGRGEFTDVAKDNAACPTEFGGRSAAVLDYDGDGLLDILVGEDPLPGYNGSRTKTSRLFRNQGNLKFADVSHESGIPRDAAGLGVAAADVNNDGWPDFFLASTLGNYLMLNDGAGRFREAPGSHETFAWPLAEGDDMVCGVAFGDVNRDGLLDVVIGQHFKRPWVKPVANRLYLNRGIKDGVPSFEDVTDKVGLVPLPLKGPHVEIQDFDNDGWPDIYVSIVKFANERPHPVIFKHSGIQNDLPLFRTDALDVNDFPTAEDKATLRTGEFSEKMIRERKIIYTAAGPSGDYDNDGRLDLFLANWWTNSPSMLLHNETSGGHWLDVRIEGSKGVNRQGIGARINIYSVNQLGQRKALLGSREISIGFGYASGQPAIAHFGLGDAESVDVEAILPHGQGTITRKAVPADQQITLSTSN